MSVPAGLLRVVQRILAATGLSPIGSRRSADAPRWIEVRELASQLDDGGNLAVVDVRGPDEFSGPLGHIVGALNIPVNDLPQRLGEIPAQQEKPVVLVCRTDRRSANAAALLRERGFRDVRVLHGGMEQWARDGLPVADRIPQARP
jgi:rhodanese-related sulfurtransferase